MTLQTMVTVRADRPARGYVLILVLALIVILTAAGAALYRASESQRWALGAVSAESLALARANMGAQQMLARMRAGAVQTTGILEDCNAADEQGENLTFPLEPLGCRAIYVHEGPANATAVDTNRLTGRQMHLFSTRVYLRQIEGLAGTERFVIDSIGYVNKEVDRPVTTGSDAITTARVEMELESDIPEGSNHVAGGG